MWARTSPPQVCPQLLVVEFQDISWNKEKEQEKVKTNSRNKFYVKGGK